MERTQRELEDTSKTSFDFQSQLIQQALLRKLAMVTTNLHSSTDFHR